MSVQFTPSEYPVPEVQDWVDYNSTAEDKPQLYTLDQWLNSNPPFRPFDIRTMEGIVPNHVIEKFLDREEISTP